MKFIHFLYSRSDKTNWATVQGRMKEYLEFSKRQDDEVVVLGVTNEGSVLSNIEGDVRNYEAALLWNVDYQIPFKELDLLLKVDTNQNDIVIGSRFLKDSITQKKNLSYYLSLIKNCIARMSVAVRPKDLDPGLILISKKYFENLQSITPKDIQKPSTLLVKQILRKDTSFSEVPIMWVA